MTTSTVVNTAGHQQYRNNNVEPYLSMVVRHQVLFMPPERYLCVLAVPGDGLGNTLLAAFTAFAHVPLRKLRWMSGSFTADGIQTIEWHYRYPTKIARKTIVIVPNVVTSGVIWDVEVARRLKVLRLGVRKLCASGLAAALSGVVMMHDR